MQAPRTATTKPDDLGSAASLPLWLAPTVVFVAAFLLYARSFDAWFAVLDFNHIDAVRSTSAGTFFLRIFDPSDGGRDIIGTGELYRPIYYSAFWLEYQLFGADSLPYYLFNAALHATNAVLVWLLAWRLTRSELASSAGAIVWAFFPQYADAVAWISSITDLLLVAFGLSAVLLYAHALESSGRRRWLTFGASFAAALLALGAKEAGIALVPIIVSYHLLIGEPELLRRPRVPWSLLPFLAIPLVYFPLRAALVGNLASQGEGTQLGWELFENIHGLSGLVAGPLLGQGISEIAFGVTQGMLAILVIAVTVVVALLGSRRERFLVCWYYAAIAPFLVLVPNLIIGRYLYLPMVGLAILAGIGVARLVALIPAHQLRSRAQPAVAATLLLGVAIWFGPINAGHQDSLTAKGDHAKAFLGDMKATHPVLPEGGRLIIQEHPRSLSFESGDLFMLQPAVRLVYGTDVEVVTPQQLNRGEEPPERAVDRWFPLRGTSWP